MDDPEELDVTDQVRKEDRESPALRGARHDEYQPVENCRDCRGTGMVAACPGLASEGYDRCDCTHKPRLLDLFCCEGGASEGYRRCGFDVFGVDLFEDYTQARYPFPSHKGDAIEFVKEHGHEFDAIHASPPCQHASAGTRALRHDGAEYPKLIPATRDALVATGLPYVIENVRGADLDVRMELCGCMFGLTAHDDDGLLLRLERTRQFESNIELPQHPHDHDPDVWVAGCYGGSRRQGDTPAERRHNAKYVRKGGYVPSKEVCQRLLGIDWMTWKGMHQALPPVYTEHIGNHLALVVACGRPLATVGGTARSPKEADHG